jgi:hypothetical protein
MMIDDDTLKQLLRINDKVCRLRKWLNEARHGNVIQPYTGRGRPHPHADRSGQEQIYTDAATPLFGNRGLRTEAGDQWMVP